MDLQHWAVKMDATPCLITMDFSVCTDGNAGFSVEVVMKSQVEICDFFYYYQKIPKNKKGNNNNNNNSKKNKNNGDGRSYSNSIVHGDNGFDYRRLKWNVLSFVNPIKKMGDKSDIRVVDIADFIYSFTNSTGNYNAVTNNCQSFAYRLYKKVIGHKYPIKCSQIGKLLQSPHDQTKIKNESNNFDIGASARENDSDRDHTTRDARIRLDYRKLDNSDAGNINPHGAHPRASRNDDRLMRHEHHGQSGHHHHSKDEQRQHRHHRHHRHGKHQPHHSTVQGATHPGEAI